MTEFTFEYNNRETRLYYKKGNKLEEVAQDKLLFVVGTTKAAAINKLYNEFSNNMNTVYWDSYPKNRDVSAKLTLEIKD